MRAHFSTAPRATAAHHLDMTAPELFVDGADPAPTGRTAGAAMLLA